MQRIILLSLICSVSIATLVNCKWGAVGDDLQSASKVSDIQLAFYYHAEDEVYQIIDHISLYTGMINCNANGHVRYSITINSLANNQTDTVISKPKFSENVDKYNLALNMNWADKCLREFKGKKLRYSLNQFISETSKISLDSAYSEISSIYNTNFFFTLEKDENYLESKYKILNNLDSLKHSIDTTGCSGIGKISIIWNPRITKVDTGSDQIKTIVTLPENKEAQNSRKATLGSRTNLTWKENYELASLKAESNDRIESIWTYLNTAAKMAIDANESDSIYLDIQLPIVESRFSRIRSDSPGKWRGLRAGLDRGDKNLIGVILGPINRPNANGCFPVNLLVPYTESSTGNFSPQYKLTTNSLSRQGSLVFNFGLLIENRNEWESKDNISIPSGGNITMDYNISKKKVTIENYTNPGSSFATVCIRFTDMLDPTNTGEDGTKKDDGKLDKFLDNDNDGFIGYLDINDAAKTAYPKLENADLKLYDKIEFKVTNGENLDGVKYDWFVNGVKIPAKHFEVDQVGCYDLMVRMTHENSGVSKDLSSRVHCKLPVDVLKKDLEAILKVGQYKPPSQPPTIEKKRADEAEERIYSYFASGCNDVRDQHNQKKSLDELLTADLMGGAGKIFGIEVKSITYKNSSCDKVCSFVYELKQ